LAISVLVGGVLQLFAQQSALIRTGMRFKIPKTLKHPGALHVGRLFLPRLFGAGVYQATVLLDTFCASLASIVGPGGVSAIYYANRIIQLPMGVFSVALASAALPSLANFVSSNDTEKFKKALVFSLENIFFIMFPTSIITMLLSVPLIRVLFQRGQFDEYSTAITAGALLFYCIGLFSFGAIKIMVTAFHAMQDTRTPVKVAAICLLINAALNFLLMWSMKVSGITLASSVAATVDFMILFSVMEKRLGGFDSGLRSFILKILIATIITGVFVYGGWHFWVASEKIKLFVVGISGFIIYGVICLWLKVEQAHKLSKLLFPNFNNQ
jgi:putative peptidoglycan lipid II flippase